jgi:hypothetical protein
MPVKRHFNDAALFRRLQALTADHTLRTVQPDIHRGRLHTPLRKT